MTGHFAVQSKDVHKWLLGDDIKIRSVVHVDQRLMSLMRGGIVKGNTILGDQL